MKYLIGVLGLVLILGIAWLASNDRKSQISPNHNDGYITIHFGILLLNTSVGNILISGIADGFGELLKYVADGVNFVFGGLVNQKSFRSFMY